MQALGAPKEKASSGSVELSWVVSSGLLAGVLGLTGSLLLGRARPVGEIRALEYDAYLRARTVTERASGRERLRSAVDDRNLFVGSGYALIGVGAALGAAAVGLLLAWIFEPAEGD